MFDQFSEDNNPSITKFEQMLKTNQVLFFDALEFESIIHHYIDFSEFKLARKALKMAMAQHPKNVELMLLESELLLFDGSFDEAESLLLEIEQLSPYHEEVFLQRASIFSKKKNHTLAIELLEKALDLTDDEVEVWNLIGMEYLFLEDYFKAKKFFLKCVEENPYDYQSLYNLLYCYEQLEEDIEAIGTLNKILETNPYSEIAWHQLGKLYVNIEKLEEALSAFEFAIISDESFTGAYIEKGKLLEKMGRINEAIDNYEISLQLNDPSAYVNHRIGKSHLKLGNDDLAIQFFKKSIKLEPNHEKSWISLVDFFLKKKQYLKAQYYVQESILANGDSPDLWRKSGEIHFEMNFYEEAALACDNQVELGQHDLKTWVIWMDSLIHLKEWEQAIEVGEKALKYHESKASFLYRLAGCKMRIGMKKEGLKLFEKAKLNLPLPSKINHLFPEFTKI